MLEETTLLSQFSTLNPMVQRKKGVISRNYVVITRRTVKPRYWKYHCYWRYCTLYTGTGTGTSTPLNFYKSLKWSSKSHFYGRAAAEANFSEFLSALLRPHSGRRGFSGGVHSHWTRGLSSQRPRRVLQLPQSESGHGRSGRARGSHGRHGSVWPACLRWAPRRASSRAAVRMR